MSVDFGVGHLGVALFYEPLYLPDATPMSASNRLRIWITRNKTLMDKLHNLGYVKKTRLLTREMVKEIVAVIGEP